MKESDQAPYQRHHKVLEGGDTARVGPAEAAVLRGPQLLPLHCLHVLDQAPHCLLLILHA